MGEKIDDYHGLIVNISQKNKSIWHSLDVIGKKTIVPGFLILFKVRVAPDEIEAAISNVKVNMRNWFYVHFYRDEELIIVYKNRIFRISTDRGSWDEAIDYGRSIRIPKMLLDFYPCRFEDESF